MTVFVNRVAFPNLDTALRIFKAKGLDRAAALAYFSSESNRRAIVERYDTLSPLSVLEALALPNAEQRMAALAAFSAEEITARVEARTLDRQTILKRQVRWNEDLEARTIEYQDTYELLTFRVPDKHRWASVDIFVVKCNCPSTGRTYFLYVPQNVAEQNDAIAAIAWTMQVDGHPLSKAEYIALMYAET